MTIFDKPEANAIDAEHMAAANGVGRDFGGANLFSPWVGFAILCAYTVGAFVIGGILMVRRDA